MNYTLPFLPERGSKPRKKGIAMVMDKGLGFEQARNMVSVAGHLIDYVKLGFGTSIATNGLRDKINFYHQAGIKVYLGGTMFEAFIVRDMFEDYINLLNKYDLRTLEISDSEITLDHQVKCDFITKLSEDFEVLSEVGTKESDIELGNEYWIEKMSKELKAGSTFVIAEAHESGTAGIYNKDGTANQGLIDDIRKHNPADKILWETPHKLQQTWFIKHFGADVNLGNIAPDEVITLETLRLGLREDTFFEFLPDSIKAKH